MDNIKIAEKKIDDLAEFLQHNINLGYITRETTVDEILMILQNTREGYLPLMSEYNDYKEVQDNMYRLMGIIER